MMARFLDGPAAAIELMLRRCPVFLRVVQDTTTAKIDALDQLDDTPSPSETVHVYRRIDESHAAMFVCGRGRGPTGRHEYADYRYVGYVEEELVRGTAAWRAWCERQAEAQSTVGAT